MGTKKSCKAKRSEERVSAAIFQQATEAQVIFRAADLVVLDANAAFAKAVGRQRTKMIGFPLPELAFWPDLQLWDSLVRDPENDHQPISRETSLLHRNGERMPMRLTLRRLIVGRRKAWLATFQAQAEFSPTTRDYEEMISILGEGAGIVDDQELFVFANSAAEIIFGVPPGQLVGQSLKKFMPPDQLAKIQTETNIRRAGRQSTYDIIIIRSDGQPRHLQITALPMNDANGRYLGAFGFFHDVTDRRQAEETLRESEIRYRYFVEKTNEGFYRLEADGPIPIDRPANEIIQLMYRHLYIAECNDAFARMYGYQNAEKIAGVRFVELHGGNNIPKNLETMGDFVRSNYQMLNAETRELDKEGKEIIFSNNSIGIIKNDLLVSTWGTQVDITARKRAEMELQRYREHLEELVTQRTGELAEARDLAQSANYAKSAFLANMSHELRTPLTAVLGFAEIISRDPDIPDRIRENLGIIIRSGEHLQALINDILDLSKIEAGRIEIDPCDFDLGERVRDVINMMRGRAEAKGLRLVLDQSSDFPRFVNTDPGKFRQILVNLVGNAIKFTTAGEVTIKMSAQAMPDGHLLMVEVRDTGIGIRRGDLDRIFHPFEQIGSKTEGTGLGLTITRQYVQMLGGRISVNSEPEKGSCFSFTIRAGTARLASDQSLTAFRHPIGVAHPLAADIRILIVEDNEENRRLLRCFLEPLNFQIREAVNGLEAVVIFQEWRPQLVFMDRRMPVLDGLAASRQIKALPGGNETILIAVSAHSFEEEQREMLTAGCKDFLNKPFSAKDLFFLMKKHLNLEFIYAQEEEQVSSFANALSPEDLRVLPLDSLKELLSLANELDEAKLTHWLESQSCLSQAVRTKLSSLIRDYRFDVILENVEPLLPPPNKP